MFWWRSSSLWRIFLNQPSNVALNSACFLSTHRSCLQSFCIDLAKRNLVALSHPSSLNSNNFQSTSALPDVVYAGFDPTSDSLHVGNLLIVNSLLRAALHGCSTIAIIGTATAFIGDPSGRTSDRIFIESDVIERNAAQICAQFEKILSNFQRIYDVKKPKRLRIINNSEWHSEMSAKEFLRICRSFRVGEMLRLRAIKSRMQNSGGIPCSEFLYQILQSYDWYRLAHEHNCYFQIGGSDQLGHLDMGYDYIRKETGKLSAGICLPLITNEAGSKLGKSEISRSANVWLSDKRTSPYAFYQFWKQKPDEEVTPLLRYFSLRPLDEVEEILKEHNANLGKWIAQQFLAEEMTELVHGSDGLNLAQQCTRMLFEGSVDELETLSASKIEELFGEASILHLSRSNITTLGEIADKTRSDKVRGSVLMRKGALKLNGLRYTNPDEKVDMAKLRLCGKNLTLVCWGKRKFQLIKWSD